MSTSKDTLIKIYFFTSILLFSFFMPANSYVAENTIVPHVKVSPLYIHFFISILIIIVFFLILRTNELIIDSIFILLVLKIISTLIPVLYTKNADESFGLITIPIISALAYYIGRQYKGMLKDIIYIQMIFVVILSMQTIYTVANMVVPNIIYYEQHVKIPIGSSNLIAAYLVPCLLMILLDKNINLYLKYSVSFISFAAVIASTSIGALLILFAMLIIYCFYFNNRIDNSIKLVSVFIVIIVIIVIIWFIISFNISLSDLTHQRSDLIKSDVLLWLENPLLGNGMIYIGRGSGSHNIVVDLLTQNGIIGFLLYVTPVLMVLRRLLLSKNDLILGLKMYLIATLFHSMIETSYFNYTGDMLFWFICGIAISQSEYNVEK